MKAENLIGKKFNRLLVKTKAQPKGGVLYWEVLCDCGVIKVVRGAELLRGDTKSCGCLRREIASKKLGEFNPRGLRPFEALYNQFKAGAKRRGKESCVSYDEFLRFTETDKCQYCHAPVRWVKYSTNNKNGSSYNLDRKNNSGGYSLSNCVVCCWRCNQTKGSKFSYEEWYGMTSYFRNGERDQNVEVGNSRTSENHQNTPSS